MAIIIKDDVNTGEVKLFNVPKKKRLDFNVGKEIGRIIDKHGIDIVHCTMRNAMLFGYLGIRYSKRQPKLIAAVHSTKNVNVMVDVMDLLIYKSILKKCAQVWFVSSSQKDRWVRRMPFLARRAITIHNGIDLDEFEPTRFQTQGQALKASLGITEDENVLCLVSVNYSFSRIDSMILLPNGICCLIVFVIEIWEVLGFAQVSASKLGWS